MAFDPALVQTENKIQLTLDSSAITEDQTDFPLTVHLDGVDPLHAGLFADLIDPPQKAAWDPNNTGPNITITSDTLITKAATAWNAICLDAQLPTTGKVYFEFKPIGNNDVSLYIAKPGYNAATLTGGYWVYLQYNGVFYENGTQTKTLTPFDQNDVVGFAVDMDTGDVWLTKNGVSMTGVPGVSNPASSGLVTEGSLPSCQIYFQGMQCEQHSDITDILYLPDGFSPLNGLIKNKKLSIEANGVQCPVEIESWDSANEKAVLHTKVPTYSASVDTELVLSYDSSQDDNDTYVGVTGSTPAKSVWDSNFAAVYHMAQDPSVGGACILDSTVNVKHGTPQGAMTSGDLVDGLFGKGINFDGNDDYIRLAGTTLMNGATALTLEAKCKTPGDDNYSSIIGFRGSEYAWLAYFPPSDASGELVQMRYLTGLANMSTVVHDEEQYYAGTWSTAGTTLAYFDGILESSDDTSPTAAMTVNDYWLIGFDDGVTNRNYKGDIYEVRISNIARSADWIKLTNLSLTDQLITYSLFSSFDWNTEKAFKIVPGEGLISGEFTNIQLPIVINKPVYETGDDDFTGADDTDPNPLLWSTRQFLDSHQK